MKTIKVKTNTNVIVGKTAGDSVNIFKGIPYAKAPIGDLRWVEPQRLESSEKELEAFEFGDSGIQPYDEVEAASTYKQGEDCLKLNIWSKFAEGHKKPVMVFIHGGSYMSGGSADPLYDGYSFAANNDVVMVTINYRLSVLSAINISAFGGNKYSSSGQLALLDQICALEWINENIAAFGGDNGNITIFGESCGGGSVSLLMTMPKAKGLFQKVIAQSGAYNLSKSPYLARLMGKEFVDKSGCKTMDEMLNLPQKKIREIIDDFADDYGYKFSIMFAPEADGVILPEDPLQKLDEGCAKDVKLMLGTNANEFNYWKLYIENIDTEMPKFLADQLFIQGIVLHYEKDIMKEFFDYRSDRHSDENHIAVADEVLFRMPAIKMAEAQAKHNDTYMYYFSWESNIPGLKSCHALELPFVFRNLKKEVCEDLTGPNPPEDLGIKMQKAWVSFAENGDPNYEDIPNWERYNDKKRPTMIMDNQWKSVNDPEGKSREIISKMTY